jgi:hypothetical protein
MFSGAKRQRAVDKFRISALHPSCLTAAYFVSELKKYASFAT